MIRITKLLTVAVLIFMIGCEQTELEEAQIIDQAVTETEDEELEFYPIMIFDRISAKAQLWDCESGITSYNCAAMPEIVERTIEIPAFSIPKRPRHCPQLRCGMNTELGGTVPRVPGTICEPDICNDLSCLERARYYDFAVKASSLEDVAAYLIDGSCIITSTDPEQGGSISEGFECNSAQLNFGKPLAEVAKPGMMIYVKTVVNIQGELVKTSFKVEL